MTAETAGPALAMIASSRGDLGTLASSETPPSRYSRTPTTVMPSLRAARQCPSSWASTLAPSATPSTTETATASPVLVPGTTCEMTGTPSAAMTATDNTQDGATTIGTPPIRPSGKPRAGCRRAAPVPAPVAFIPEG